MFTSSLHIYSTIFYNLCQPLFSNNFIFFKILK
nr:MAG TPA: hypothetical protein [Caudoviricetes sp.]